MNCVSDPYQPLRMMLIWPVLVGCIGFYSVRLLASLVDRRLTRWQALMACVAGLMAGVVTTTIARAWDGSPEFWLAFTIGLAFAALVLLANAVMAILCADGADV